jgi:hypothetical protein
MEDEKNEMNQKMKEMNPQANDPDETRFVHKDQSSEGNPALQSQPAADPGKSPEQLAAEKKKRKTWTTVGIILLIVVGIPLLLFGTCILLFTIGGAY